MRSWRCWTCTGRSSQPDRRVLALSRPGPRGWPDPGPRRAENYFAPDVRITAVRLPSDSGQGVTGGHQHAAANASDLAISASRRLVRHRPGPANHEVGQGMGMCLATVAIIGLVLLIRPDRSVSVPAAGLLLALLAAVLHAAYIVLGRRGWGEIGDGAATFLIVATATAGLGVLAAVTRPATVLVPVTDLRLTTLLLLEGALAGAAAPLLFLAGLRRGGGTQTAVPSLCGPLAPTPLAA